MARRPSILLVSNDFPPLVGGIETCHREWLNRLRHDRDITVLAPRHPASEEFDRAAPYRVVRAKSKVLWPTARLAAQIEDVAAACDADFLLFDPPLPLGLVALRSKRPWGVFVHGGVAVQSRPPVLRQLLGRVLSRSQLVIAAGEFSADEARRAAGRSAPPIRVVYPGVDAERYRVPGETDRLAARIRFGLPADARLILSLSRLVPRKGMATLVEAVARLAPTRPDLYLAIAGAGRERSRIESAIARTGAAARMLGRVADEDLPALYGSADVFAMVCHNRWGGLEQEGFGAVFAEAAACGVPSIAGDSGGASEAVIHGETGFVVGRPRDPVAVAEALARLLDDPNLRKRQGEAARQRAVRELSWDVSAARLSDALDSALGE